MNIGFNLGITAQQYAGGGSVYNPVTDIPSLRAFWDASDTASIDDDGSNNVTAFRDQTAGNYDAEQTSAAVRPTTGGSINGHNAIVFTQDLLKIPADAGLWSTGGGDFTVMFVGTFTSRGDTLLALPSISARRPFSDIVSTTIGATTVNPTGVSFDFVDPQIYIWRVVSEGSSFISRAGSTAKFDFTAPEITDPSSEDSYMFALNDNPTQQGDGTFGQMLYVDEALSDANLNAYGSFVADKYGVAWSDL